MGTIIVIVVGFILFFVAIVSPHMARKVQHRTDQEANLLKRLSNWLWDPLTWWAKVSLEFTRKSIVKIAAWGKKTRKKLPF